jgi:predicted lysophospholipase L1 biosynthesis ABC-type transport system permease subunit
MLSQMAAMRLLAIGIGAVIGITVLISWVARGEGATPPPSPGSAPASFWDSFGRAEVFVLTVPVTLNRWRHLRDVISTGPWPATLIEGCTPQTPEVAEALVGKQLQEKAVALVCSHLRAVAMAKDKNLGASCDHGC